MKTFFKKKISKVIAGILLFLFIAIISSTSFANNISVSNVSLSDLNTTAGINDPTNFVTIKFDVSWDNSWRSPNNIGDAAWVFVKYRVGGQEWATAIIGQINLPPNCSAEQSGIGLFIYRSLPGFGTFTATNIQLRWNYGLNHVNDNDAVEVQVFAIEMVYVPEGSFAAGDGLSDANQFTLTTINTSSFNSIPGGAGSLGGEAGGHPTVNSFTPAPDNWPNGVHEFFCMKYEISQGEYCDFLNTLTYDQQIARFNGDNQDSYYIKTKTSGIANTVPAVFGCDLNNNHNYDEVDDGEWIACNYLDWDDLGAYLDWSGLRPMTELEFEKASRGPVVPVAGEYAWGNTNITEAADISNNGSSNEICTTANANAVYNNNPNVQRPMRVGVFSTATTNNRESSGASYYGIMNLSDNLSEQCVTMANPIGLSFIGYGNCGDGIITQGGNANEGWPFDIGRILKGGSWSDPESILRISDRSNLSSVPNERVNYIGGRGIRDRNN